LTGKELFENGHSRRFEMSAEKSAEKVADLMVPISAYATVSEEATLYDAVVALGEAKTKTENLERPHHHRAVLVVNKEGQPIGKISHWVALRAIEPKYGEIGGSAALERFGFTSGFISSIMENHGLWQEPLDSICRKAARVRVRDIMYTPAEGEYVAESAPLEEAIHHFVMGHHQSLLVTRGAARKTPRHRARVVGVLRIADVFDDICQRIKASRSR
jgi:hypothetical protein